MARKEELKELRMRQRRALIVDFDLEKASVFEVSVPKYIWVKFSKILLLCVTDKIV